MLTQATIAPSLKDESSDPENHTSGPDGLGYTLWRFDGTQWEMKKNCPAEGAVAGPPPALDGKFEGQLRATACVAA